MKKIFISISCIALIYTSCKPQEEAILNKNAEEFKEQINLAKTMDLSLSKEYQQVRPAVKFYNENPNQQTPDIQTQLAFIQNSGLPLEIDFPKWKPNNTAESSVSLYTKYINENSNHKFLNVFRQYEGWLLLTHFDLLSDNSNIKQVKAITNELINSHYDGYKLLYYSLDYLLANNALSTVEKNVFYTLIENYSVNSVNSNSSNLTEKEIWKSGKPIPPGLVDLVNKRIKEKEEDYSYLSKIKSKLKPSN